MLKKFEEIKNINVLMGYIAGHGIPTDTESVVKMQDIVGHTTIDTLDEIANSNSRGNLYSLLFTIWHWEDATRFYNQHTNPEYKRLTEAAEELKAARKEIKSKDETIDGLMQRIESLEEQTKKNRVDISDIDSRAAALENENIRLKAKLYDLIAKEA